MDNITEIPWFFSHIFPWPFVFVGGGMVYDATRTIIRAHRSHGWKTIEGEVVTSNVKSHVSSGDDDYSLSYIPVIEYQYLVEGEMKTSDKIGLVGWNDYKELTANAVADRYSVGRRVRVYCSPYDPDLVVLEPGLRWPHISELLVGLFFLTAGMTLLWVFGWMSWLFTLNLPRHTFRF